DLVRIMRESHRGQEPPDHLFLLTLLELLSPLMEEICGDEHHVRRREQPGLRNTGCRLNEVDREEQGVLGGFPRCLEMITRHLRFEETDRVSTDTGVKGQESKDGFPVDREVDLGEALLECLDPIETLVPTRRDGTHRQVTLGQSS